MEASILASMWQQKTNDKTPLCVLGIMLKWFCGGEITLKIVYRQQENINNKVSGIPSLRLKSLDKQIQVHLVQFRLRCRSRYEHNRNGNLTATLLFHCIRTQTHGIYGSDERVQKMVYISLIATVQADKLSENKDAQVVGRSIVFWTMNEQIIIIPTRFVFFAFLLIWATARVCRNNSLHLTMIQTKTKNKNVSWISFWLLPKRTTSNFSENIPVTSE